MDKPIIISSNIAVQFREVHGNDFIILTCTGCGTSSGLNIEPTTMSPTNDVNKLVAAFERDHNSHEPHRRIARDAGFRALVRGTVSQKSRNPNKPLLPQLRDDIEDAIHNLTGETQVPAEDIDALARELSNGGS